MFPELQEGVKKRGKERLLWGRFQLGWLRQLIWPRLHPQHVSEELPISGTRMLIERPAFQLVHKCAQPRWGGFTASQPLSVRRSSSRNSLCHHRSASSAILLETLYVPVQGYHGSGHETELTTMDRYN
jgi:hypothetical protein